LKNQAYAFNYIEYQHIAFKRLVGFPCDSVYVKQQKKAFLYSHAIAVLFLGAN